MKRGILFFAILVTPMTASASPQWVELAFLPWGASPGEVGLTEAREDELQRGPHGITVAADGRIAVVDRVNGRAWVLSSDGDVVQEVALAGRPGPAALLSDGALAVADERDDRLVRLAGDDAQQRTPRWAMPPSRLVSFTGDSGQTVVQGLDPFQLRLPLSSGSIEPHPLSRGVPTADGEGGVYVVRREDELWVEFPEGRLVLDESIWPGDPGQGYGPGATSVLAATEDTAAIYLESVFGGLGPIRVIRAVALVDLMGRRLPLLSVADMGPVVIPSDLAALPDGRVFQLVSDADGCRLLRAHVGEPEVDR